MIEAPNPLNPGKDGAKVGPLCGVCFLPHKLRSAIDQKLVAGEAVTAVWRWANRTSPKDMANVSVDVFYRHRRTHTKAVVRAARKLSDSARMQREKIDLAKAVLNDVVDPQAFFSPAALAQDIGKTEKRLDAAATDAFTTKQHSALSSLSGALIRSYELRGKLGGGIRPETEINISIGLQDLHGRLDALVGRPTSDRSATARNLLGLSAPAETPMPIRIRPEHDLEVVSNPGGPALTIDGEIARTPRQDARQPSEALDYPPDPESSLVSPSDDAVGHSEADQTGEIDVSPGPGENLGTRWR